MSWRGTGTDSQNPLNYPALRIASHERRAGHGVIMTTTGYSFCLRTPGIMKSPQPVGDGSALPLNKYIQSEIRLIHAYLNFDMMPLITMYTASTLESSYVVVYSSTSRSCTMRMALKACLVKL
ncbi:hypothetical protein J1614_007083 [Plenodomus biglobosus]|nr:hypothetical protein J1614_007083 [Plenodomus biglobosus]